LKGIRNQSLAIFFGILFLLSLGGQSIAGYHSYNDEERARAHLAHEKPELLDYGSYLTSPDFSRDVMENWQSEYLQFLLFILATVWLVQRGSPESKKPDDSGTESDREQKIGPYADDESPLPARAGGLVTTLYSNSLLLLMGTVFVAAWFAQSLTGWRAYNEGQISFGLGTVGWGQYLGTADFWSRTLQNWQSEFLAVGSMAVFAIYLRQRGSPESKPVGASHTSTGVEG
jgi:hypothetical protein